MTDPFTFDPISLTWKVEQDDHGRLVLRTCYQVPGVCRFGMDRYLDGAAISDPLQISGIVAGETQRVIGSFQHTVAGLSAHQRLAWLAAANDRG